MRERKQIRLKNYNYSLEGYYFVTICTKNREEWFGKIGDGSMILNTYGEVAKKSWNEIPQHFKDIKIDQFSVMPNHVHGILMIEMVGNAYMRSLQDRTKMLLSKIMQQYKSSVTREINFRQKHFYFQWQRSFYDHVIRNEKSLNNLREYVVNNPLKWNLDRENPLSKNFNFDHDRYWKEIYESV